MRLLLPVGRRVNQTLLIFSKSVKRIIPYFCVVFFTQAPFRDPPVKAGVPWRDAPHREAGAYRIGAPD